MDEVSISFLCLHSPLWFASRLLVSFIISNFGCVELFPLDLFRHRIPVVRTSLGEVQRIAELVDGASNTCPHLSIRFSSFIS